MSEIKLNTIEEAIEDFREGKFLIVVDDEDRENEGDFIVAAEKITPEKVNFMMYYAPRSPKNVARSWTWICRLPETPLCSRHRSP